MKLSQIWRRAVKTITQETEQDLALRLLEVEAGIAAGTGDVAALLQEGRELKDKLTALRLRSQAEANAAFQKQAAAVEEDARSRYEPELAELYRLLPQLMLGCAGLRELSQTHPDHWGRYTQGLDPSAPGELLRAIGGILPPGTELDMDGAGPVSRGIRIVAPMRDLRGNFVHDGSGNALLPVG